MDRKDDAIIDYAVQGAFLRLRQSIEAHQPPDPHDLHSVQLARLTDLISHRNSIKHRSRDIVIRLGPPAAFGAGFTGFLIWLVEKVLE